MEDLARLPYFAGTMDRDEAARLVESEPVGTFLLRANAQGQLRVTLRGAGGNVQHVYVERGRAADAAAPLGQASSSVEGLRIGSTWSATAAGLVEAFSLPGKRYHFSIPYLHHRTDGQN